MRRARTRSQHQRESCPIPFCVGIALFTGTAKRGRTHNSATVLREITLNRVRAGRRGEGCENGGLSSSICPGNVFSPGKHVKRAHSRMSVLFYISHATQCFRPPPPPTLVGKASYLLIHSRHWPHKTEIFRFFSTAAKMTKVKVQVQYCGG